MPGSLRGLGRRPRLLERILEPRAHTRKRQPLLRQRVPLTNGDRVVLERLVVDGERPRRADLVLPAVTPSDLPAVVVLDHVLLAKLGLQSTRLADHLLVLRDERQDGGLHRRDLGMKAQHGAVTVGDDLLVVAVDEHRHEDALDADGRLDDVRGVSLAVLAVPLELRTRRVRVRREIEVAAVRNALELLPADGVEVLDVARPARVVRALLRLVLADTQPAAPESEVEIPLEALLEPVLVPPLRFIRRDEVLHLHLLEL